MGVWKIKLRKIVQLIRTGNILGGCLSLNRFSSSPSHSPMRYQEPASVDRAILPARAITIWSNRSRPHRYNCNSEDFSGSHPPQSTDVQDDMYTCATHNVSLMKRDVEFFSYGLHLHFEKTPRIRCAAFTRFLVFYILYLK